MLPWRRRAAARRVRKVIANPDSTTVPQRGPAVSRIPERYGVRIYARLVVRRGFIARDQTRNPQADSTATGRISRLLFEQSLPVQFVTLYLCSRDREISPI
jgi:hypothetical protein